MSPRRWWSTIRCSRWTSSNRNLRCLIQTQLRNNSCKLIHSLGYLSYLSRLLTNNLRHVLQKRFHSWSNCRRHKLCITRWSTTTHTFSSCIRCRWCSLLWLFYWNSPWTPVRCSTWTSRTTTLMFSRQPLGQEPGTSPWSLLSVRAILRPDMWSWVQPWRGPFPNFSSWSHKTRMSDSSLKCEQLLAPLPREIYPAKISWNLENQNSTRNPQVR